MTRADVEGFLARHQAAFLRLDIEALTRDHAPDGVFVSPAHGTVRGRVAIEKIYHYWFTAFPDLHFTWSEALIDGDRVALVWHFSGTQIGPFFGLEGGSTRIEMEGVSLYRLQADGIVLARHLFDFSDLLVKTGVLKIKPSVP